MGKRTGINARGFFVRLRVFVLRGPSRALSTADSRRSKRMELFASRSNKVQNTIAPRRCVLRFRPWRARGGKTNMIACTSARIENAQERAVSAFASGVFHCALASVHNVGAKVSGVCGYTRHQGRTGSPSSISTPSSPARRRSRAKTC